MEIRLRDNLFFLYTGERVIDLKKNFLESVYAIKDISKSNMYCYKTNTIKEINTKDNYKILFFSKNDFNIEKVLNNYKEINLNVCIEIFNLLNEIDYSLVIIDEINSKIYSFRSANGVVPLYYFYSDNNLIISMHVHSIAKAIVNSKLSNTAIEQIYAMDCLLEPNTFYDDIYEISRSFIYEFDLKNKNIKKEKVYSLKYSINSEITLNDSIKELENGIIESHYKRLGKDNAIMLSGGVDSNVMCYALKNCNPESLESFNVSVKNQENSEAPYAKKVADFFGIKHNEVVIEASDIDESIIKDIININFPYWGIMYTGNIFKKYNLQSYNVFTGQDTRLHTPFVNLADDIILNNKMNMGIAKFVGKTLYKYESDNKIGKMISRCKDINNLEYYLIKHFLHCPLENKDVSNILLKEIRSNIDVSKLKYQEIFNEITWVRWGQQFTDDIKYMDGLCGLYNNTCQFPFYDIKLAEISASIPFKHSNKLYIGKSGFSNSISINKKYLLMKMLKDKNVPIEVAGRKKAVSSTIHLYFNEFFGQLVKEKLKSSELLKNNVAINLNLNVLINRFCEEKRKYTNEDSNYLTKVYNIFMLTVLNEYIKS